MKKQFILILSGILILSSFLFINAQEKKWIAKSPKFSHQKPLKDEGMECTDCHASIAQSTKADDRNLPGHDVCQNCHDVEDDQKCTYCHIDLGNLEPWPTPMRKFYFNHQAHGKLSCQKCHEGIEKADIGGGKFIPSQQNCNSCHNGLTATMECLECHSSSTPFRPDNHVPAWSREHAVHVRANVSDCGHCHTGNYCQECHESTSLITTKILPQSYYPNYSPHLKGQENQVIKSVHGLNYRFVHQLDAAGKEKDCQICHETSSYCAQCHNSGFNAQMRPAWHGGPDWGAIALGVGTGGGRHAELARRDIERCAACHEVQGADPACLQCHTDFDGIRNTNPKTHGSGFANRFEEDSDFHHDDGAICFTCHTNTKRAGVGFCGYCHGHKEDEH
ncbi:MAG: cytochrome C [candidate division KSB1 bacterium]|nr:cytochrome C [candidate division KSB1 bacterium]